MSGADRQSAKTSNVTPIRDSEADRILMNLRRLREDVINAWFERAVILTSDEQQSLRSEIRQTCQLLTDLTAGG